MKNDVVDTDAGICVSVWLQGCPFHCKGCHNPETWDFDGGIEIEKQELLDMTLDAIGAQGVKRNLSILGGEPLCNQNLDFTEFLIHSVKQEYKNIKIFLWTGFEFHQLKQNSKYDFILNNVDTLITGRFIQEQRDLTLPLRGSRNQQIYRRNQLNQLTLQKK